MAEKYQVKQGESIGSIAYEHGIFWETLWNDCQNRELAQRRKDPNVLKEGDTVYIPDITQKEESCPSNKRYRFVKKGVPSILRLRILAPDEPDEISDVDDGSIEWGKPNETADNFDQIQSPPSSAQPTAPKAGSNIPYILWIDDVLMAKGKTTADVMIECAIVPNAREGKLVLEPGTSNESVIELKLGYLDPLEEISGVQGRLNNLGFHCGPEDGVLGPRTRRALKSFQAHTGLQASGELDQSTRKRLYEEYEKT